MLQTAWKVRRWLAIVGHALRSMRVLLRTGWLEAGVCSLTPYSSLHTGNSHPNPLQLPAELFNRNSARLDSQVSQEIQYGEAAVLAAGAPSWDGGSQLLADAAADAEAAEEAEEQRAAGQPHQGPPNLHRPSPFQSEGRNGAGTQ